MSDPVAPKTEQPMTPQEALSLISAVLHQNSRFGLDNLDLGNRIRTALNVLREAVNPEKGKA